MEFFQTFARNNQYFAGKLVVDFDPAAEQIMVIDRRTAEVLFFGIIAFHKVGDTITFTVPEFFASTTNLIVVILDQQTVYDLAGADKVQADLVNMADL